MKKEPHHPKLTFLFVLKSGGDFTPDNAIAIAYQVRHNLTIPHRFVCLTDMGFDDPMVDTIPLRKNLPGWWSVIEMFRIDAPVVASGLDTVIVNNIDSLGELAITCPADTFYMTRPQPKARRRGEKMCSGVMIWNGDWSWLYAEFDRAYIPKFKLEQRYTTWKLTERMNRGEIKVRLLQDYFTGFYSYKNDCRGKGLPKDAKVIGFHGNPRPSKCRERWVKNIYHDRTYNHSWDKLVTKGGMTNELSRV